MGFRMAFLPGPEYEVLQTVRGPSILGGVTQRQAFCASLRLTAKVINRPGGLELLKDSLNEHLTQPPSETGSLISLDRNGALAVLPARAPEVPTSPVVEPERRTTIALRHRHTINGVVYGPGASVDVPAGAARDLLMTDRRADDAGLPRSE